MAAKMAKTIKIGRTAIDGERDRAGTATLTPVTDPDAQPYTYLVSTDARAREYFGGDNRTGTIGGICLVRPGCWGVVAYRDRAHLSGGGAVTDLPNAKTRAAAVRGLLRYYLHLDRGDLPTSPTSMSKKDIRYLMD